MKYQNHNSLLWQMFSLLDKRAGLGKVTKITQVLNTKLIPSYTCKESFNLFSVVLTIQINKLTWRNDSNQNDI